MPTPSLYETLEVSPQASPSVIRAAYRCLAQQHHPDKHLNSDAAGQRLAQINFTYSVLADPLQRRGYDIRERIDAAFVERRGQDGRHRGHHAPDAPLCDQLSLSVRQRSFADEDCKLIRKVWT